jgi:hypothetical protein
MLLGENSRGAKAKANISKETDGKGDLFERIVSKRNRRKKVEMSTELGLRCIYTGKN